MKILTDILTVIGTLSIPIWAIISLLEYEDIDTEEIMDRKLKEVGRENI